MTDGNESKCSEAPRPRTPAAPQLVSGASRSRLVKALEKASEAAKNAAEASGDSPAPSENGCAEDGNDIDCEDVGQLTADDAPRLRAECEELKAKLGKLWHSKGEVKKEVAVYRRKEQEFIAELDRHMQGVEHNEQELNARIEALQDDQEQLRFHSNQQELEQETLRTQHDEMIAQHQSCESRVQFLMDHLVNLLSRGTGSEDGNQAMLSTILADGEERDQMGRQRLELFSRQLEEARQENRVRAQSLSDRQCQTTALHERLCKMQNDIFNPGARAAPVPSASSVGHFNGVPLGVDAPATDPTSLATTAATTVGSGDVDSGLESTSRLLEAATADLEAVAKLEAETQMSVQASPPPKPLGSPGFTTTPKLAASPTEFVIHSAERIMLGSFTSLEDCGVSDSGLGSLSASPAVEAEPAAELEPAGEPSPTQLPALIERASQVQMLPELAAQVAAQLAAQMAQVPEAQPEEVPVVPEVVELVAPLVPVPAVPVNHTDLASAAGVSHISTRHVELSGQGLSNGAVPIFASSPVEIYTATTDTTGRVAVPAQPTTISSAAAAIATVATMAAVSRMPGGTRAPFVTPMRCSSAPSRGVGGIADMKAQAERLADRQERLALEQRLSMERAERRPQPTVLQAVVATTTTSSGPTTEALAAALSPGSSHTAPSGPPLVPRRAAVTRGDSAPTGSTSRLTAKLSASGGRATASSQSAAAVQVLTAHQPYARPQQPTMLGSEPGSLDIPLRCHSARSSSAALPRSGSPQAAVADPRVTPAGVLLSHSHSSPPGAVPASGRADSGRPRDLRTTRRARASEMTSRRDPPRPPHAMSGPARRISSGCSGKDPSLATGMSSAMKPPPGSDAAVAIDTPRGAHERAPPSARRAHSPPPDAATAAARPLSAPPNGRQTPTASMLPVALPGPVTVASLRSHTGGASTPHRLGPSCASTASYRHRIDSGYSDTRTLSPGRSPSPAAPRAAVSLGAVYSMEASTVQRLSSSPGKSMDAPPGPSTVSYAPSFSTCRSPAAGTSPPASRLVQASPVGASLAHSASLVSPRGIVSPRAARCSSGSLDHAGLSANNAAFRGPSPPPGAGSFRTFPQGRLSMPQPSRATVPVAAPPSSWSGGSDHLRRVSTGSPQAQRPVGQVIPQRQSTPLSRVA